jgi:hypothetical protein
MMMSVEQSVESELAGEAEVLGEILPLGHYGGKPVTNCLSYDMAIS